MQNFNTDFNQAIGLMAAVVRSHLENMTTKYITREELCGAIGVGKEWAGVISTLFEAGHFPEFETVKSRGIRRKVVAEVKAAA